MLTYRIDAKRYSPEVFIDKTNQLIEISGSSTLKNTSWFYSNVMKWVIAFNARSEKFTTINIRLEKINEESVKWITLIMKKLRSLFPDQLITINWYYEKRNVLVQLSGERVKLNAKVPVNLIAA
ncbi:MAG: DUF1987 family protein [Bacteroidota bacterium]|nr:MAG: DUF1987 family protein [Bacteroidota bacterium]